jgi:hypothetical protein
MKQILLQKHISDTITGRIHIFYYNLLEFPLFGHKQYICTERPFLFPGVHIAYKQGLITEK